MSGGLLNQFASVHKDQCLRGVRTRRVDTINQLCEDNLPTISCELSKVSGILAVLPLPVARDTPSRLWPWCMYESTD